MKRTPYRLVSYPDGVMLVGPCGHKMASSADDLTPWTEREKLEWVADVLNMAWVKGYAADRRKARRRSRAVHP